MAAEFLLVEHIYTLTNLKYSLDQVTLLRLHHYYTHFYEDTPEDYSHFFEDIMKSRDQSRARIKIAGCRIA